jgi:excisionase family DNA binding protein
VDKIVPPFTIETLANRWNCSENHIRNLINSGKLPHFRIGPKLIRISLSAVLDFEEKCSQPLVNTEESTSQSIMTKVVDHAVRLERQTRLKRSED